MTISVVGPIDIDVFKLIDVLWSTGTGVCSPYNLSEVVSCAATLYGRIKIYNKQTVTLSEFKNICSNSDVEYPVFTSCVFTECESGDSVMVEHPNESAPTIPDEIVAVVNKPCEFKYSRGFVVNVFSKNATIVNLQLGYNQMLHRGCGFYFPLAEDEVQHINEHEIESFEIRPKEYLQLCEYVCHKAKEESDAWFNSYNLSILYNLDYRNTKPPSISELISVRHGWEISNNVAVWSIKDKCPYIGCVKPNFRGIYPDTGPLVDKSKMTSHDIYIEEMVVGGDGAFITGYWKDGVIDDVIRKNCIDNKEIISNRMTANVTGVLMKLTKSKKINTKATALLTSNTRLVLESYLKEAV